MPAGAGGLLREHVAVGLQHSCPGLWLLGLVVSVQAGWEEVPGLFSLWETG